MPQHRQSNHSSYIPKQGDIVYINFQPQRGHEQKGRRPALVINNQLLSEKSSLAFFLPITNVARDYPTHIKLDERTVTTGAIMCEQLKSLDYKTRGVEYIEKLPNDSLTTVKRVLQAIIK